MATFTLWRGRADTLLLWASLALFLLGLPVALWLRLRAAHKDSLQDASLPEGGVRAQARDGIGGNHS